MLSGCKACSQCRINCNRCCAIKNDPINVGTTIQTPGAVYMQAGEDINAKAATIQSNGKIELAAGQDINLLAGELHQTVDEAHKHKGHTGGAASLTITTRDMLDQTITQIVREQQ